MRGWVAAALVLGALLVGACAALWTQVEKVEEEVPGIPGLAALANPFLAAERMVEALGIPAHSRRAMVGAPDTSATVIWLAEQDEEAIRQLDDLIEWVEEGGHLITEVGVLIEERLGTTRVEPDDERAARVLEEFGFETNLAPTQMLFDHDLGEVAVVFEMRQGDGHIDVVPDLQLYTNELIGEAEHASMLWWLVSDRAEPTEVVFVHALGSPSLWELLRRKAWPLFLALWIATFAWAWRHSRRFGPIEASPSRERRDILEHVHASGRFLYRHDRHWSLVADSRQALFQLACQRHPTWRRLSRPELAEAMAELSGLPIGRVRLAMAGESGDESRFLETVRDLETLRRSL